MADCLTDNREQGKVKHPLNQLISQRVYQIVAGYEDANDSNYLRHGSEALRVAQFQFSRLPVIKSL